MKPLKPANRTPANRTKGPRPKTRSNKHGSQYALWSVLRRWGVRKKFTSSEWADEAEVPTSTAVHYALALRKSGIINIVVDSKHTQVGQTGHIYKLAKKAGAETPIILDANNTALNPNAN